MEQRQASYPVLLANSHQTSSIYLHIFIFNVFTALQVMTPEGPKQLRQLQSQKRRGVFQNLADAALMALYLYKMPIPLFSIPALSIAHSYVVIMAVYMCSEWHAFAHRADCTGKTVLQSLQAFAQQTWSTYAADHTLYHVPLEIHAVLTTFQKIVHSVYLQQVLTSKVACMLVSFSALYVALSILRRGLL